MKKKKRQKMEFYCKKWNFIAKNDEEKKYYFKKSFTRNKKTHPEYL